jgi:hypothetical protein
VHKVDARHHLKQLTRYVGRSAVAGRRHRDLAGIGFGIGDEFGNASGRDSWVHHHGIGLANKARNRRDVTDEVTRLRVKSLCAMCSTPIVEVVLGVQFNSLERFLSPHLGVDWITANSSAMPRGFWGALRAQLSPQIRVGPLPSGGGKGRCRVTSGGAVI